MLLPLLMNLGFAGSAVTGEQVRQRVNHDIAAIRNSHMLMRLRRLQPRPRRR